MELDLKKMPVVIKSPSGVGFGSTNVESEIIISDIKPDIARVLMSEATVKSSKCDVKMGRVTVSGEIETVVFYAATTRDQPVRAVSQMVPYTFDIMVEGAMPHMQCETAVRVAVMEAKAMNARKIKVKMYVEGFARVYAKMPRQVVSDIEGIDDVQTIRSNSVIPVFVGEVEDSFSISETFELPTTSLPIWEVLMSKVAIKNAAISQNAGYADIRAEGVVTVFYTEDAENGQLKRIDFGVPVSGVIRISDLADATDLRLSTNVISKNLIASEDETGELKNFKVELEVMAVVEGYAAQEVDTIEDAFAPGRAMSVEKSDMMLENKSVIASGGFSINSSIEIDENLPDIAEVVLTDCKVKECQVLKSQGKIVVSGTLDVKVLYNGSEEDGMRGVSQDVSFEREIDLPAGEIGDDLSLKIDVAECSCTASSSKTLEPRFEVNYEVVDFKNTSCRMTENITLNDAESALQSDDVIVFVAKGGETAWDIAKKHLVKIEDVLGVDGMPLQSSLEQGEKVIIF